MSGSSQRRGIRTQKEQNEKGGRKQNVRCCKKYSTEDSNVRRVDLSEALRATSHRRHRNKMCTSSGNLDDFAKIDEHKLSGVIALNVVLEEVLSRYGGNFSYEYITKIIVESSDWERTWKYALKLRDDAVRLKKRIVSRQDCSTLRMILGKTLNSKERRLRETLGSHPGTPDSSDSEEEDQPLRVWVASQPSKMLPSDKEEDDSQEIPRQSKLVNVLNQIEKVEVNITSVDKTPKYLSKIEKADQVTITEDKALKPHVEKNIKITKNHKDDEEAEQEEKDAQPQVKPAAFTSTHYLSQSAAEVSLQRLQHYTIETTPTSGANPERRTIPGSSTFSCDVKDFEF